MRKLIMMLTAAIALGATLTGFGETVTNVRGVQRQDSDLVDIYYDLNATDGGTYTVEVTLEGKTESVPESSLTGDVGEGVSPGKNHHIVWNAGADWPDKKGDVRAVVTTTREASKGKNGKIRLWAGGPYWATKNIGADNPWDYGLYFWWGDTTGHRQYGFYFVQSNCETSGKSIEMLTSEGWITVGNVLSPDHDAAHVHWGEGWRMPTLQEISDLNSKCDWTWTTMNGVNGCVVRGRGYYAANSIFLPAAGYGNGNWHVMLGSGGTYWSSEPYAASNGASMFAFGSGDHSAGNYSGWGRHHGFSVRPVQGVAK